MDGTALIHCEGALGTPRGRTVLSGRVRLIVVMRSSQCVSAMQSRVT